MCVPKILIALSSYAENVEMTINLYRVLINVYKDCSVLQSLVDALVLQVCGGEPREQVLYALYLILLFLKRSFTSPSSSGKKGTVKGA